MLRTAFGGLDLVGMVFRDMASMDGEEVEWQFDALDLRPVERWLAMRPPDSGLAVVPRPTLLITDTYLDTHDWRLHRAGYSLRLREESGGVDAEATLKSLTSATGGQPRVRREISETLPKADHELLTRARGPVAEHIRALSARQSLEALATVRTTRRGFAIVSEGVEVGELVLDHTEIPVSQDDVPFVLNRVELESAVADSSLLADLAEELRDACGLQVATRSKFESGLLAAGLTPPGPIYLGPTAVDSSMAVGDLAFSQLRRQFSVFLQHEAGARLGEDPEDVHDMRVATRRLRAALTLFEAVLPARSRWLRKELGWIAGYLGVVRDLDVQLEQVRGWAAGEAANAEALGQLVRIIERRRREARRKLIRALDSLRFQRLVRGGAQMLLKGPLQRNPGARAPVLAVAPELIGNLFRKVRKVGDGLDSSSDAELLHRLRIRCKRLRYALEFVGPIYGKAIRSYIKRVVAVQEVLGDHQDAHVAVAHLRSLVETEGARLGPQTLFHLGWIAHRYQQRAEVLRVRFPVVYDKLKGKAWGRAWEALEEGRTRQAAIIAGRSDSRRVPGSPSGKVSRADEPA
jgi:triphosphatase